MVNPKRRDILVVGAGFSGAVVARQLAEAGCRVQVIDQRDHVAGNCYTERDPETGVLVHRYGPHIFHTDRAEVWDYVTGFAPFEPYAHRVKTIHNGQVFGLPINLQTINQFFGQQFTPVEARAFVAKKCVTITQAQSFEDRALATVGPELYAAFFQSYTAKQWGCDPKDIPASVFSRLPVRYCYDDRYFSHRFQGMPRWGYTDLVTRILRHPLISVSLKTSYRAEMAYDFRHVFHSGTIDGFFDYDLGRLPYRSLRFETLRAAGDQQGCAVMNYADHDVPYTRITEHQHFAPWEAHRGSVRTVEYPKDAEPGDTPYYPLRAVHGEALLKRYVARATAFQRVTFLGRLGTYRYLDMDLCIAEALSLASRFLAARHEGRPPPVFSVSPV